MTDNVEADQRVFERVNDRILRGVPAQMEMSANEIMPYVRAAMRWERAAMNLFNEKVQSAEDAMRLHTRDSKYSEAGQ